MPCRMLVQRVYKDLDRRRGELNIDTKFVRLLQRSKCTNVTHKDTEQQIFEIIALGRCHNSIDFLDKRLLLPLGNPGK